MSVQIGGGHDHQVEGLRKHFLFGQSEAMLAAGIQEQEECEGQQ